MTNPKTLVRLCVRVFQFVEVTLTVQYDKRHIAK
jgi:hypothetical protein